MTEKNSHWRRWTLELDRKISKKIDTLNCATWNIKRGLVLREFEIKEILEKEKIDILFLTETDTRSINCETD